MILNNPYINLKQMYSEQKFQIDVQKYISRILLYSKAHYTYKHAVIRQSESLNTCLY